LKLSYYPRGNAEKGKAQKICYYFTTKNRRRPETNNAIVHNADVIDNSGDVIDSVIDSNDDGIDLSDIIL
jgi:hypothetical protein